MNKIVINNGIKLNIDNSIDCEYINDELIKKLTIKVLKDTKLEIIVKCDIKLDISVEINKNIKCDLLEIKEGSKFKIQNKYILRENSLLNITKLNKLDNIFERNIINLKEKNSTINYVLKTVCSNSEKYDIAVNHNDINTNSNIINNGVNINNGILEFNVTATVPKGKKNCTINQNNRIINLTNNNCTIRPILLIDEVDVSANHSALIGNFKNEEYFYIERLGIDKKQAMKMLLEGFIKSNCNNQKQLNNMFEKYWR